MRRLTHPGEASLPRREVVLASAARDFRVQLPEGLELLEGLSTALEAQGISAAGIQFIGGTFSRLAYLTGQPDASGERVATYGQPTHLEGPVRLLGANAILGRDKAGRALLHCHAVLVDREGHLHGGHLPPDACIVGPGGLTGFVTAHEGAAFRVAEDAETNYAIFQPAAG